MVRILGLDPGSRVTGFGVVDAGRSGVRYVASGSIRAGDGAMPRRLLEIHRSVTELVETYAPGEIAIERVFMHRNPDSALKLGQARGAAISAVVLRDLPVHEYAASEIKLAVVGRGGAEKQQVQHMVGLMLNLKTKLQADAADALAVAITHAHVRATANRLGLSARQAWGRK